MNKKWHINPNTGEPGICVAEVGKCLYKAPADAHFFTEEAARAAFEKQMESNYFPSYMRKVNNEAKLKELQAAAVKSLKEKTPTEKRHLESLLKKDKDRYYAEQKKAAETKEAARRAKIAKEGVQRDEKGSLFVKADMSWGKNQKMLFGDLTPVKNAEELHRLDPEKTFQDGYCAYLSDYLGGNVESVSRVGEVRYAEEIEDPEFGKISSLEGHAFVELNNGIVVDSMGFWSKDKFAEGYAGKSATIRYLYKQPTAETYKEENPEVKATEILGSAMGEMIMELPQVLPSESPLWDSLLAEKAREAELTQKPKSLFKRLFGKR